MKAATRPAKGGAIVQLAASLAQRHGDDAGSKPRCRWMSGHRGSRQERARHHLSGEPCCEWLAERRLLPEAAEPDPPPTGASPGRPLACRSNEPSDSLRLAARRLVVTTSDRPSVRRMTGDRPRSTWIRCRPARPAPAASARTDLIGSPWLTATQTASVPCSAVTSSSSRRTAFTPASSAPTTRHGMPRCPGSEHSPDRPAPPARADPAQIGQPAPGPAAAVTLSPVVVGPDRETEAAASGPAVSRQRSKGLLTIPVTGRPARSAATAAACATPRSVRATPGVQPAGRRRRWPTNARAGPGDTPPWSACLSAGLPAHNDPVIVDKALYRAGRRHNGAAT